MVGRPDRDQGTAGGVDRDEGEVPDSVVRGRDDLGRAGELDQRHRQAGELADAVGEVDRDALGLGAALGHAGPDGGAGGADGDGDPDRAGGGEAFEHHGAGRRKRT
jgi:hypothetical protein